MTSEPPESSGRAVQVAVGIGVGLVLAGTAALLFRVDRPDYELTPDRRAIHVSLDDLPPNASRNQVVTIQVENTGRRAVRLAGVETTCGCTVAQEIPDDLIEPGGTQRVTLSARLPSHGTREAMVVIQTDPPTVGAATVELTLQGRTVQTPYVGILPGPIHLGSERPGGQVVETLQIETGESIGSETWLTGLTPSVPGPAVELLDVVDGRRNETAGIVARTYTFRLTATGPESRDTPTAFTLTPKGHRETESEVKSIPVRVVLNPSVRAYPESVQIVLDDSVQFPLRRTIKVQSSRQSQLPAITNVSSDVGWIDPQVVSDDARRDVRLIQLTIAPETNPSMTGSGNVAITLEDPDVPPVHVAVSLIQ